MRENSKQGSSWFPQVPLFIRYGSGGLYLLFREGVVSSLSRIAGPKEILKVTLNWNCDYSAKNNKYYMEDPMNSNIFKAILWKESRQIGGFIIVFAIALLVVVYYDFFVWHLQPGKFKPESTVMFLMMFNFIITFFSAAGLRIIERANQSDSFLLTRPMERKWIFWTYYSCGIINWLAWMLIATAILLPAALWKDVVDELFSKEDILMVLLFYFFFYTTMFSLAILIPKLPMNLLFILVLITFEVMSIQNNSSIEKAVPVFLYSPAAALVLSNIFYVKNIKS